jgi:short-subunit dehydrogenase
MPAGKTSSLALVTGASSGIGKAFARELAARGADIIAVARDEKRLGELATELRDKHGRQVEVLRADLRDSAQLAVVEGRLRADAGIDLLVNNAGYGVTGAFAEQPVGDSQGQIDLNVTALTRLARAALASMRPGGRGGVINVASGAAFMPTPSLAVYAATKAYVLNLSQALHEEVRGDGLTVTVVCPGFTRTEFQARAHYDASAFPDMAWQTPEQVVRETLDAFTRRKPLCVPGVPNRLMAGLLHLVPRSALAPLVTKMSPRQTPPPAPRGS